MYANSNNTTTTHNTQYSFLNKTTSGGVPQLISPKQENVVLLNIGNRN